MKLHFRPTRGFSAAYTKVMSATCYFLLTVGVAALGYVGYVSADSKVYQVVEKEKFTQAREKETLIPAVVSHHSVVLREGDVIGEIQVPRLGLDAMVVQGDSASNLQRAVAHISNSALPGEWGNVALAGHRDTFFRPLRDIRAGDEIRFKTAVGAFEYRVRSVEIVGPRDTKVLQPFSGRDLTLITCFPFSFVGRAPGRFVVRATEVARLSPGQSADIDRQHQGTVPPVPK
jgi:sortase A